MASWGNNAGNGGGWAHPLPKEERLDAFRLMVEQTSMLNASSTVAIIGHAAYFKSLVNIKMTSCQLLWKDSLQGE
eukprot:SAG22_NODE_743_length_7504_cov_4.816745_6_plen_75_part_00